MNAAEKVLVRCTLTVFVLAVTAFMAPLMLLLKLAEGVVLATKITKDCLTQVWSAKEPR